MFIGRRLDGSFYGCWRVRQPDDADHPRQEEVSDDDPEVLAFLHPVLTEDEKAALAVDAKDRLLFEIEFDQENRIRAIELRPAITRAQYRDALIARWKQLNS